jgi:hypothetical protein
MPRLFLFSINAQLEWVKKRRPDFHPAFHENKSPISNSQS